MKKFLSNNPYRILGVPSNSGLRLITKNVSKFKAYSKLGKSINTEYDFSFLNLSVVKRDQTNISKSQNSIINDDDKIKFSLFWFINISPFDSIALSNLVKKDVDKTIEIWRKCVKKSITKNNYSAYNNLSTLLLIKNLIPESNLDSKYANVNDVFNDSQSSSSLAEIKEALSLKYSLLSSDFFNEYKSQLSKGNDSLTNLDFKDFFSQTLLDSLKLNYSNSNLINLFKGLDSDLVASLSSNLIKEPLEDIKNNINSTNAELEKNALKGMILGRELIKSTLKNIKNIKDIAVYELRDKMISLDREFVGSGAKAEIGEKDRLTIMDRLSKAMGGYYGNSYGPTELHMQSFDIAQEMFDRAKPKMDAFVKEVHLLGKLLEDAGGPIFLD